MTQIEIVEISIINAPEPNSYHIKILNDFIIPRNSPNLRLSIMRILNLTGSDRSFIEFEKNPKNNFF